MAVYSPHITLSWLEKHVRMINIFDSEMVYHRLDGCFFNSISKIDPDRLIRYCLDVPKYNRWVCKPIPIQFYLLPFGCTLILSRQYWLSVLLRVLLRLAHALSEHCCAPKSHAHCSKEFNTVISKMRSFSVLAMLLLLLLRPQLWLLIWCWWNDINLSFVPLILLLDFYLMRL